MIALEAPALDWWSPWWCNPWWWWSPYWWLVLLMHMVMVAMMDDGLWWWCMLEMPCVFMSSLMHVVGPLAWWWLGAMLLIQWRLLLDGRASLYSWWRHWCDMVPWRGLSSLCLDDRALVMDWALALVEEPLFPLSFHPFTSSTLALAPIPYTIPCKPFLNPNATLLAPSKP